MKLIEVAVFDETPREFKNPVSSIDSDNPLFGAVFDAFDDAIWGTMFHWGLEPKYKELKTPREKADLILKVRERMAKIESVPITHIIATEPFLDEEHIKRLASSGNTKGLPTLALYDGKYYVMDGNHRVAIGVINGESKIKAKVIKV